MIDLSDKSDWYLKGISKAIAYEYIREYDLSDVEIACLYKYVCAYLIATLFDEFKISDDPVEYASILYHGEKAILGYLGTVDPKLMDDKVFKLELLAKDRERVLEDYYLYKVSSLLGKDFDYERYDDAIEDVFTYLVTQKEENLARVREDLVK